MKIVIHFKNSFYNSIHKITIYIEHRIYSDNYPSCLLIYAIYKINNSIMAISVILWVDINDIFVMFQLCWLKSLNVSSFKAQVLTISVPVMENKIVVEIILLTFSRFFSISSNFRTNLCLSTDPSVSNKC